MSSYQNILIEHAGPISWLILNRPHRANALSRDMLDEFSAALEELRHQGGPVIGIRGAGKGFSAGMDLDVVGKVSGPANREEDQLRLQRNVDRWLAMWDHPKPIVAAIHGYCIAAATQLCIFADITMVADDATIGEPTIPIGGGFIAPVWSTLVGPKRAKEFSFVAGNTIDGPTAVEWGFANHSVPKERLIEATEELAARIAKVPPEVLRIKKLSINRAAEAQGFRAALAHIAEMDAFLHVSPEVASVKARVAAIGIKGAMAEYRTASTMDLSQPFSAVSSNDASVGSADGDKEKPRV